MSKKRFYNDKKRNTQWTQEPQGRKIPFADKYIDDGNGNKAVNQPRGKSRFSKEKKRKALRTVIIAVLCFCIISVGYIIGDVRIIRNSGQGRTYESDNGVAVANIQLQARLEQPLSFDGGVMLDSVISELSQSGFSSVCIDLKREDGTVGYQSALATISAYGAIASPAGDLGKSVGQLKQNDILPVGRVCVYRDNIAARADESNAVTVDGDIYEYGSSAYLNPDSENTYNYIKGIIEEAKNLGIEVFVLDYCELPDEISENYGDGFETLSAKLYNDLGDDVKLLKAVNTEVTDAQSAEDIINGYSPAENEVLVITCDSDIREYLEERLSYILIY